MICFLRHPLLPIAALALFSKAVLGFSFTLENTSPKQCEEVEIKWSGGQSPWSLTIIPAYDYPTTVSIPSSSYDGNTNTGSYNWTVNYPSGTSFVIMMSDGSGTGTGGVSPLYKISGTSSSSCNLRSASTDFLFYLNETSLTQCDPVEIYWDASAVSPVSILGAIPGGQVFQLVSADGDTTSLVWNTNIQSGTKVIFAAFDSGTHKQGGSSDLLTIGGSSDSSCIDSSSPSSTSSASQATQTGTSANSSSGTKTNVGGVKTVTAITTETASPGGAAGLSTGAIVGIVVSAVLAVAVLQIALVWFCCRRQIKALIYHRREMRGQEVKPGGDVDLGLASRNSYSSVRLSDQTPVTGDYYAAEAARSSHYSNAAHSGVPRSGSGDDFDAASSISPFWDGAAPVPPRSNSIASMVASSRPPTIGALGFDSDTDSLVPPRPLTLHDRGRNDSLSNSSILIPETIGEGGYPSPAISHTTLSPLVPGSPNLGATGSNSNRNMTKAQMATSLNAHNPDESAPAGEDFGARLPPQNAPTGGFRRHEDAGRIDAPPPNEESVEDLPPMYMPEWENDSQRQS
ncbi:hypothetical protein C367_03838 [Cryptococcus neoformans Ze90-1]|nr:hypothetical protein C367_03838 [Cryptococcus neoformans var. grubii Ze90-1]